MYPRYFDEPGRLELPRLDQERPAGVFWKPSSRFVTEVANYLKGKMVLEIFAGNGLLAGLLENKGVSVTATSILSGMDAHCEGLFHDVIAVDALSAVAEFGDDKDVLLICWPTTTEMVTKAAKLWGSGRDILFIGEMTDYSKGHLGGCATDSFFEAIAVTHEFKSYGALCPMEKAVVARLRA